MKKKYFSLAATLVVYVTLFLTNVCIAQNVFREYAIDLPIGDYEFTDCNTGMKRSTHDPLNEGKVLYIAKMATWCPYCKDNTKANFNKDVVDALLAKYKDKLEVWLMFDGPTDCNGAKSTQNVVGLTGANVFLGVDNNDISSKLYSWGTPTILIIDPKTKKVAYPSWEFGSVFSAATETLDKLSSGTFTYPTYGSTDNIVQFKKVKVSSVRDNNEFGSSGSYVTDGKKGTSWSSALDKAQDAWCVIDLEKQYQITDVQMTIVTAMDSKKIKIQLADNENGPWTDISMIQPAVTQLKFRITSTKKGRYFRVLNAEINDGFVLSLSDLVVKGITDGPAAVESIDAFTMSALYPNPAKEYFNVNTSKDANLQIINENGSIVREQEVKIGETKVDAKNLLKGIYLVRLTNGNYVQTSKIIIE